MSADNFVGVRPNADGTYSIFEYGNMSVFGEDCMYLSDEKGIVAPARDLALVRAHDIVNAMDICEYGVVEMPPVRERVCGHCYMCVNQRKVIAGDIARCDHCGEPITDGDWITMNARGTFHSRCERQIATNG